MENKVQIQIVTYNSAEHLPRVFKGIEAQTDVPYSVVVIDNNSTDNTVAWIKDYQAKHPNVSLIANPDNKGFGKAHNQGFAICTASYVLILNPDTELASGFLKEAIKVMDEKPKVGSVAPKLYREMNKVLDSCGLALLPWGQVKNWGEGKYASEGDFDQIEAIFGPTGACALYRLEALKTVVDKYGIFDERFWMYKEDVDLAWRLRRAGWQSLFLPNAIAWHARRIREGDRKNRDQIFIEQSTRNHLLMLKKNLSWRDWWRMPLVLAYEFAKFLYVVLYERETLKAYYPASFRPKRTREVEESQDSTR